MKLNYKCAEGMLWIYLAGEMDHHSAKSAREETDRIIKKEHPDVLFIDASGITFCDSSGLGFIMGRYKIMQEYGGRVVVVSPSAPIGRMIKLSGMDKLIKVEGKAE